jgi:hypothetical protein
VGDTPATAQAATVGTPTRGVLEEAGNVDVYRMAFMAGELYALSLYSASGKWEALTLRITGPDGAPLSFEMNSGGDYAIGKQFAPTVSGDYYLAVGSGVFGERPYVLDAIALRRYRRPAAGVQQPSGRRQRGPRYRQPDRADLQRNDQDQSVRHRAARRPRQCRQP